MAEKHKEDEQLICPCGENAETVVHLAGEVVKCDQGFEHQLQIAVPLCGPHQEASLDGRLDGRMLLAAHAMKDPEMARIVLAHDPEPRLAVRRVRGDDRSTVVGFDIQPLPAEAPHAAD